MSLKILASKLLSVKPSFTSFSMILLAVALGGPKIFAGLRVAASGDPIMVIECCGAILLGAYLLSEIAGEVFGWREESDGNSEATVSLFSRSREVESPGILSAGNFSGGAFASRVLKAGEVIQNLLLASGAASETTLDRMRAGRSNLIRLNYVNQGPRITEYSLAPVMSRRTDVGVGGFISEPKASLRFQRQ